MKSVYIESYSLFRVRIYICVYAILHIIYLYFSVRHTKYVWFMILFYFFKRKVKDRSCYHLRSHCTLGAQSITLKDYEVKQSGKRTNLRSKCTSLNIVISHKQDIVLIQPHSTHTSLPV